MVVIDWLQTYEFVRENSESFILYCICGCLIGISIILITIIIILYIEKHFKTNETENEYCDASPYLPVYRYDGRNPNSFYHV